MEWWDNTGYDWVGDDSVDTFFHDLPAELAAEARRRVPDELPGAHFPMLGHPVEVADPLEAYRREIRSEKSVE